jgi:integrase/recombinase XerD
MNRFFSDSKTIHRYRSGPLGEHIQKLADLLAESGFRRLPGRMQLRAANHFAHWLRRRKAIHAATLSDVELYLGRHGTIKHGDGKALMRLFTILEQEGIVMPPVPEEPKPHDLLLEQFADYLERERGLSAGTILHRRGILLRFIRHCFGTGPMDWQIIQAGDVVRFIHKQAAAARTTLGAKNITTATRSFLRYARYVGLIEKDLAGAVPAVASWSLANVPKGLAKDHLTRILKSCNRTTAVGRRDYAILLLLARLGLRAGEVAGFQLDDVDWESGLITIVGKGGKPSRLPLPGDVGRAIAAYLRRDRPAASSRHLFIRIPAPHSALQGSAVGCIVRHALERAGVQSHSKGAHQLRHALATNMLRAGASLSEIGEVLRHEDHRSTSIYAKVDFKALRPLAQAWPGGAK